MSSRRVLLFVPAVVASENQTATRIAELLAQAATKARPGTWSVQSTPRELNAVVIGPSGEPELEVVQVDYLSALMRNVRGADTKPDANGVFSSLWFAVRGTGRLLRSWGRHQKSPKAKAQLTLAFFAVLLLWVCFAILLLALVAAVASVWLPDWTLRDTTGGKLALSGGVVGVLVWLYWRTRAGVLANGARLRAIMAYFEHPEERLYLTSVFDEAFDAILEKDPEAEVHVFAFSFGSIVTLDALFPDVSGVERRVLDRVSSLVTMGCPADLVHLLYPKHFDDTRISRRDDLPWRNVFMPLDILGSNFVESKSDGHPGGEAGKDVRELTIGGAAPGEHVAVGASTMSPWLVFVFRGFVVHGKYWDARQPRHLEHLLPLWLPPAGTSPPS